MILIKIEDATLYYKFSNRKDGSLKFLGFTMDSDNTKYFVTDKNSEVLTGKEKIIINDYIKAKIDSQLQEDLKLHIQTLINTNILDNMTVFEKRDFWNEALYYAGEEIRIDDYNVRVQFDDIESSAVTLSLGFYKGKFCLFDEKIGNFYNILNNQVKNSLLEIYYPSKLLKQVVMNEKVKIGTAPLTYQHLAELNHFLDFKKSVTLVLKDGKKVNIKAIILDWLGAYDILNCEEKNDQVQFFINNTYLPDNLDVSLADIAYLQYKNEKFNFNLKALKEISNIECKN